MKKKSAPEWKELEWFWMRESNPQQIAPKAIALPLS